MPFKVPVRSKFKLIFARGTVQPTVLTSRKTAFERNVTFRHNIVEDGHTRYVQQYPEESVPSLHENDYYEYAAVSACATSYAAPSNLSGSDMFVASAYDYSDVDHEEVVYTNLSPSAGHLHTHSQHALQFTSPSAQSGANVAQSSASLGDSYADQSNDHFSGFSFF